MHKAHHNTCAPIQPTCRFYLWLEVSSFVGPNFPSPVARTISSWTFQLTLSLSRVLRLLLLINLGGRAISGMLSSFLTNFARISLGMISLLAHYLIGEKPWPLKGVPIPTLFLQKTITHSGSSQTHYLIPETSKMVSLDPSLFSHTCIF